MVRRDACASDLDTTKNKNKKRTGFETSTRRPSGRVIARKFFSNQVIFEAVSNEPWNNNAAIIIMDDILVSRTANCTMLPRNAIVTMDVPKQGLFKLQPNPAPFSDLP